MNDLIIFDLDGTLVDTFPDLLGALNAALENRALPKLAPNDTLRQNAGKGTAHLIDAALSLLKKELNDDEKKELETFLLTSYAQNIAAKSRLFPDAAATIEILGNKGWRFAICTNKSAALTKKLLESLGIIQMFDAISCGDTFPFKKPDKRHILATIARTSCKRALMVGDTYADIDAAHDAGVPVIGATFGYSATPIRDLRPTALLDSYAKLPEIVAALMTS